MTILIEYLNITTDIKKTKKTTTAKGGDEWKVLINLSIVG